MHQPMVNKRKIGSLMQRS